MNKHTDHAIGAIPSTGSVLADSLLTATLGDCMACRSALTHEITHYTRLDDLESLVTEWKAQGYHQDASASYSQETRITVADLVDPSSRPIRNELARMGQAGRAQVCCDVLEAFKRNMPEGE